MVRGEGLEERSPECLLCNKGSSRELRVTLTAMLCSEAGDERVSEQGRAVRARARAASPAAPALPLAGAARVPMQMSPGRGGKGAPESPPERELDPGRTACLAGEEDAPPTGKTGVPALGFRRAGWLLTAESPPGKPQVS